MSTGISRLQLLLERDADLGVHCYFDTLLHVPSYSTTETPKWYSYLLPHNGNVRACKSYELITATLAVDQWTPESCQAPPRSWG